MSGNGYLSTKGFEALEVELWLMVNGTTISSGLAAAENVVGPFPKMQGKTLNWLMQPTT